MAGAALGAGACMRTGSCGQLRGALPRRPLATLSAPAAAQRANSAGAALGVPPGACHRLDSALQASARGMAQAVAARSVWGDA
ncbi:hypothetical protein WJX81_003951 [Elliptochloris bilobata]|uniref:Uncharacterized protein n=1 Tax=Elliptochloris bilobata TaxID=381761 RepID=A0AAW1RG80_9CHLO